jgi:hypothetical protein
MTTPPQPPGPGPYPQQPEPTYGQAGHFGQMGDYVPPPPPKQRNPLPWLLGGAGVLVIAVVVVLIVVLTGGTDTSSPKSVNDAAVKAVNDKDVKALKELLCSPDVLPPTVSTAVNAGKDFIEISATAKGDPVQQGDTATSTISVHVSAAGQAVDADLRVTMKQNNGSWCLSAVDTDLGR